MKKLNLFLKHKLIGLIAVLLIAPFLVISQPTEDEILASIDLGTEWMVAQQNPDGSWGSWSGDSLDESIRVAYTGFALTKLCDRAYEHFFDSPFNPNYEYSQQVIDGFDFLFLQTKTHGLGTGYYMLEGTNSHHEIYNASIALMALSSTFTQTRVIVSTNSNVNGKTIGDIVDSMVVYLDWGQNDLGNDLGGWGYKPNLALSDNSHAGYATLGLRYAEAFGATVPAVVKTKLNTWIDLIQDDANGGSWYKHDWQWINSLKTGNLLCEMSFFGDVLSEPSRADDALDYIENHWNDLGTGSIYNTGWHGHTQAMFCLMKGFESFDIDTIEVSGVNVNWFDDFATELLATQDPAGFWNAGYWGDQILNTCWALFVLEKVVPNAPPVAVCQNVEVFADDNCEGLAVAVDFDGGSTDPEGEALTFSVIPEGPYPLGVTTVTLTVTDIKDDSDICTATITVVDNTPPVADISPLADAVGECFVTITAPTATDNCAGALIATTADPLTYTAQGTYLVTWIYDDGNGNTLQQEQTVIVDDVTNPVITTIAEPLTMWPPNHKYETFVISDFITGVSDNCSDLEISDVYFTYVTSDELEDAKGGGDGKTFNDMVIADDCMSVELRKERQGKGNGRYYTVYMELGDDNGNFTQAYVHVTVNHNMGNPAINDLAVYEVLGPCDGGKSAPVSLSNNNEGELHLTNYPNPFNGTTTIAFTLNEPNDVTLKVYNTLGVEVIILYNGYAEAGQKYTTDFSGTTLSEGIYLYVLQSNGEILGMNKMLLIK